MSDVGWSFVGDSFSSLAKFEKELKNYQAGILKNSCWEPYELVLLAPKLIVQHNRVGEDADPASEIVLIADDGRAFSAGELMFKVHNAFVEQLEGLDHHFFQGLSFIEMRDSVPVYQVCLGS